MTNYLFFFMLIFCISCRTNNLTIRNNIAIKIYPYQDKNKMRASAMPEIKQESELTKYKGRFYYLLMNVPEIHLPEKHKERTKLSKLYPDTIKIQQLYLKKYSQDKKLAGYFEETFAPIKNPGLQISKAYTANELMEVASKFFYCDKVNSDTSVQAHVCVGLNGIKEAKWKKDFTLLEAFCYEGIFNDFDNDSSRIWESFVSEKKKSCEQYRMNITTLDQYLEDVKLNLFERMKNNNSLKKELLEYYELNRSNLALKIIN